MRYLKRKITACWTIEGVTHRVMLFSFLGALLGAGIVLMRKIGAWFFDIDDHELVGVFPLLMYQSVGGFVGGLVAGFAGLSLLSSLMHSLIFSRYFEQVGPVFSSQPSRYIYFGMLVIVLVALLHYFVVFMKNIFQVDFGKDGFASVTVMTIVGVFLFVLLHYLFLGELWRNLVINVV